VDSRFHNAETLALIGWQWNLGADHLLAVLVFFFFDKEPCWFVASWLVAHAGSWFVVELDDTSANSVTISSSP
jgi:hypothetical protein